MTCSRCHASRANHLIAFRSGLSYTAEVAVCTLCLGIMLETARTTAQVIPVDPRPAWLLRGPAKDLTGVSG